MIFELCVRDLMKLAAMTSEQVVQVSMEPGGSGSRQVLLTGRRESGGGGRVRSTDTSRVHLVTALAVVRVAVRGRVEARGLGDRQGGRVDDSGWGRMLVVARRWQWSVVDAGGTVSQTAAEQTS